MDEIGRERHLHRTLAAVAEAYPGLRAPGAKGRLGAYMEERLMADDGKIRVSVRIPRELVEAIDAYVHVVARAHPGTAVNRSDGVRDLLYKGLKADLLERVKTLRSQNWSYERIAEQFNREGLPTVSGKGRWEGGTLAMLNSEEWGGEP